MKIKIGKRVWWNDPDNAFSNGNGRVVALQYEPVDDETVISLKMDDGGEVECLRHELEREHA